MTQYSIIPAQCQPGHPLLHTPDTDSQDEPTKCTAHCSSSRASSETGATSSTTLNSIRSPYEAHQESFCTSSEVDPPTPNCLLTPTSTSDRNSIEITALSPDTRTSLDHVPPGPLAQCLVDIVAMLSTLSKLKTSNEALYEDMIMLGTDINLLFDSFCTHYGVHPYSAPVDGAAQADYYIKLFVGRYVQQLLQSAARLGARPQLLYQPKHVDRLVADLGHGNSLSSMNACNIPLEDLTKWQVMLPWWKLLCQGPSEDENHRFFHTLRQAGILHFPQLPQPCTCNKDFLKLYRDTVGLCIKLRYMGLDFSFSSTPMIATAFNIDNVEACMEVSDCVIPSLKIRRGNAGWTTIFQGYGVAPRETDTSVSTQWRNI